VHLYDSGSTNGTFVNGVRVFAAALDAGSTVRLGGTTLRVEVGDDPLFVPLSSRDRFGGLLGGSLEMRRVYAILERVASTDTTVLIQGETGTGKELAARAIHQGSRRAGGPFVAIDCGAIAETLIESELFGHVRGAFSGAIGDRKGLFEQARGGTLFLDEVGELSLLLQPKLLRALEAREVRPVGGDAPRPIDVRVVAATNRPLAQSVNEGTFREDLFYRLAVVELTLPPLRARREDVPMLANHFVEGFAGAAHTGLDRLVPALLARSWPGNVRELRNFIERYVSLGGLQASSASSSASPESPPAPTIPIHLPLREARQAWTAQFEALYVRELLSKTGGNVTRAAEIAQVNRRTFQRLMGGIGLRADDDDLGSDDDS
jgi:transcriptional regulator with PAS, ATPase and Fis domain